ncbi:MAG: alpha-ketoglutarate-dependent dioxygenase AlkB [Pseudomonadales bacterium]|nr:alpha-ketoglutarate-dependent dioxygenase AlkB [Pseudomonadales bacterium]
MDLFRTTDLFRATIAQPENLLPQDGMAKYYGVLIPVDDADDYFASLISHIQWENDKAFIYGKSIVTKRKVAWYADRPFAYTYSKTTKYALPWTDGLLQLKTLVEEKLNETFNSCLLNLYHNGSEAMGWHSDDEKDLTKNGSIASLSFGAERKFCFKHKQLKETVSLVLEHGSLLLMGGITQDFWQHQLPATKKIQAPRVNLTFRNIRVE